MLKNKKSVYLCFPRFKHTCVCGEFFKKDEGVTSLPFTNLQSLVYGIEIPAILELSVFHQSFGNQRLLHFGLYKILNKFSLRVILD